MNSLILSGTLSLVVLVVIWINQNQVNRRLQELQQGVGLLLRHAGIDPANPGEPSERVKALAQQPSQRIEAIKAYREETGADLRTAVRVIDSLKNSVGR
jgi:ribosomal protein L7/L12